MPSAELFSISPSHSWPVRKAPPACSPTADRRRTASHAHCASHCIGHQNRRSRQRPSTTASPSSTNDCLRSLSAASLFVQVLLRELRCASEHRGGNLRPHLFVPRSSDVHETNETRDDIGPKHRLAIATIINGLLARPAKSVGAKSQIFSER